MKADLYAPPIPYQFSPSTYEIGQNSLESEGTHSPLEILNSFIIRSFTEHHNVIEDKKSLRLTSEVYDEHIVEHSAQLMLL